jgi:uncharacterized membrane protein YraQ (UPF0718 family)
MIDPYLSNSIWFHSVVIAALLGSFVKVYRPTKDLRTTLGSFSVFILWAVFCVLFLQTILNSVVTTYFMSAFPDGLNVANVVLGLFELWLYHRYGEITPVTVR